MKTRPAPPQRLNRFLLGAWNGPSNLPGALRLEWRFDAAGHMPYGLFNGSFLFRSGFLLITGLLAGYLREQAYRAEVALQGRLEQANLFNEVTARLTATLEADATLHAVTEAAPLLLGGGCAVLRPAAELAAPGEDWPSVTCHRTTGCSGQHADLLALCDEYAVR